MKLKVQLVPDRTKEEKERIRNARRLSSALPLKWFDFVSKYLIPFLIVMAFVIYFADQNDLLKLDSVQQAAMAPFVIAQTIFLVLYVVLLIRSLKLKDFELAGYRAFLAYCIVRCLEPVAGIIILSAITGSVDLSETFYPLFIPSAVFAVLNILYFSKRRALFAAWEESENE